MKTVVFVEGPLEHNHMRFESVPSEIRVKWRSNQVAVYLCMHHETPTGNVKYTHDHNTFRCRQKHLIEKR